MPHHGNILKRTVERKGLTQEAAGQLLGYSSRQAFTRLYDKEEFNEVLIDRVTKAFGISRSTFYPENHTNVVNGIGNAVGTNNTTNVNTLSDCQKELEHWMAIAKANEDRARAFEQLAEERKEMIDLLKKGR